MIPQYRDGRTVKFICIDCDFPLYDPIFVSSLTAEICRFIGMTPLSGPFIAKIDNVSSVLLIYESHIAIRTWPYYKAIRIVIDSCSPFSIKDLSFFFEKKFKTKKIDIYNEIPFFLDQ